MPAEIPGTWRVLDEAIGVRRRVVARRIGRPDSSFEKYLLPPASIDFPNGNGATNPLDVLATILDLAEHPRIILDWLNARHGGAFVPKGALQGKLFVTDDDIHQLTDAFLTACTARKPSPERIRSARDELQDALHRRAAQTEKEEAR